MDLYVTYATFGVRLPPRPLAVWRHSWVLFLRTEAVVKIEVRARRFGVLTSEGRYAQSIGILLRTGKGRLECHTRPASTISPRSRAKARR